MQYSFFKPFVGVISFMLVIFGFSWGVMGLRNSKTGVIMVARCLVVA